MDVCVSPGIVYQQVTMDRTPTIHTTADHLATGTEPEDTMKEATEDPLIANTQNRQVYGETEDLYMHGPEETRGDLLFTGDRVLLKVTVFLKLFGNGHIILHTESQLHFQWVNNSVKLLKSVRAAVLGQTRPESWHCLSPAN